jgi:hypothetical protein
MDYTIVTAWYDVREKENHPLKDDTSRKFFCPMDWYFDSAKLLFNKPFPMVIFTEPRFKDYIISVRPPELAHQTKFIFKDYKDLLYYDLYPKYEENHRKSPIYNVTQEKFTALYKFIVNQKVNFVKEVVETNPFNSEKFAWMDMRLHCVYDMPVEETTQVMNELSPERVLLMQMNHTDPVYERTSFYAYTRGKVAAGFFAGYREPILEFCRLCQEEFLVNVHEGNSPSDEMIYSYVISRSIHLFDLYTGEYSDCLRNQIMIRKNEHFAFSFLQVAYDKNIMNYVSGLSKRIRRGYIENHIQMSAHEIHKAWFYCFLADRNPELILEYFDIANKREDVAAYIREHRDVIKAKISEQNIIDRLDSI